MNAKLAHRGMTHKRITVTGLDGSESDTAILNAALVAAGEDRSSIFGYGITRWDDDTIAIVVVHTD